MHTCKNRIIIVSRQDLHYFKLAESSTDSHNTFQKTIFFTQIQVVIKMKYYYEFCVDVFVFFFFCHVRVVDKGGGTPWGGARTLHCPALSNY